MLFPDRLVVVRGGGDLATGAVAQLRTAGFPVIVLELAKPLAVRRTVAFATAVDDGAITIEAITGRLVTTVGEAVKVAESGHVAVMVSEVVPAFSVPVSVLVDGRMAKRNIDTSIGQAPLVIALGPGFDAGIDCDAAIETNRGHHLGRIIWLGGAAANTGIPGAIGGASSDRVLRAPADGTVHWSASIGDIVTSGELLGFVGTDGPASRTGVSAGVTGIVRGLIGPDRVVTVGMKIGDVDPRAQLASISEISDKARLVGAGVLQAVLTWLNQLERSQP